jgi:hypothetical protein
MKTAFYTTAMVLVLLGALAVLDKNNDFSLTQREVRTNSGQHI